MPTARDAGLAALQSGDVMTAITQLEAACQEDPNDYQAHLYLGGAYGQSGRHMDAVNILTKAVQLDPANAQARYNLGVAMEQAGYRDQALQVFQQAIQLQPDYPKAQEAIQRLQGNAPPTTSPGYSTPPASPSAGYGAPSSLSYAPPTNQPPVYGQPMAGGTQPGQPPLYGQPGPQGQQTPPYGQPGPPYGQQPPVYGQPSPFGQPSPYNQPGMTPMPTQTCPEATQSLIFSLLGFFCCGLLAIVGIVKGIQAKKIIAANPYMEGAGVATAGVVIGIVSLVFQVIGVLVMAFSGFTGPH